MSFVESRDADVGTYKVVARNAQGEALHRFRLVQVRAYVNILRVQSIPNVLSSFGVNILFECLTTINFLIGKFQTISH